MSTSDCFLEHSMSSTFFQGRDSTGDFTIYNLRGSRYHRNFGLKIVTQPFSKKLIEGVTIRASMPSAGKK